MGPLVSRSFQFERGDIGREGASERRGNENESNSEGRNNSKAIRNLEPQVIGENSFSQCQVVSDVFKSSSCKQPISTQCKCWDPRVLRNIPYMIMHLQFLDLSVEGVPCW